MICETVSLFCGTICIICLTQYLFVFVLCTVLFFAFSKFYGIPAVLFDQIIEPKDSVYWNFKNLLRKKISGFFFKTVVDKFFCI